MRCITPMHAAVVAAVVVLSLSFWAVRKYTQDTADFKQKVHVADSLRSVADSARAAAILRADVVTDSLRRAAVSKDSALAVYKGRLSRLSKTVDSVQKVAPDTCLPYLAASRAAVDSAVATADSIGALYEQEKRATGSLMASVDSLKGALDASKRALDASHEAIKAAPHRSFFQRLIPKPGFGGFGGVCTDGKPCAGVGVHLGWDL
jgi:hypothetical protein